MATITLQVDGEPEFNRRFSRLDAQFDDLSPIWPDVRDEFWQIESEQFDTEGQAGRSGKWQPLSTKYEARKIEQYGSKPILQASGELKDSLTGYTSNTVYRPGKDDVAIGSRLPYGLYHQQGAGRLPRRPPISFSDIQRRRLMKVIQASLVRELRKGVGYVAPGDRENFK